MANFDDFVKQKTWESDSQNLSITKKFGHRVSKLHLF